MSNKYSWVENRTPDDIINMMKNQSKERKSNSNIINDTSKIDSQNVIFSGVLDETPTNSQEVFTQNVFNRNIPNDNDDLVSTQDEVIEENNDIIEDYHEIQQKIKKDCDRINQIKSSYEFKNQYILEHMNPETRRAILEDDGVIHKNCVARITKKKIKERTTAKDYFQIIAKRFGEKRAKDILEQCLIIHRKFTNMPRPLEQVIESESMGESLNEDSTNIYDVEFSEEENESMIDESVNDPPLNNNIIAEIPNELNSIVLQDKNYMREAIKLFEEKLPDQRKPGFVSPGRKVQQTNRMSNARPVQTENTKQSTVHKIVPNMVVANMQSMDDPFLHKTMNSQKVKRDADILITNWKKNIIKSPVFEDTIAPPDSPNSNIDNNSIKDTDENLDNQDEELQDEEVEAEEEEEEEDGCSSPEDNRNSLDINQYGTQFARTPPSTTMFNMKEEEVNNMLDADGVNRWAQQKASEDMEKRKVKALKESYKEIETRQKSNVLQQLFLLEKNGNVILSKKWTMKDPLDEMMFEYSKLRVVGELDKKVLNSWRTLMTVTNMAEMCINTFNPCSLEIEGYSTHLYNMEESFKECLRDYHKNSSVITNYSPKVQFMTLWFTTTLGFLAPKIFDKIKEIRQKREETERLEKRVYEEAIRQKKFKNARNSARDWQMEAINLRKEYEALKSQNISINQQNQKLRAQNKARANAQTAARTYNKSSIPSMTPITSFEAQKIQEAIAGKQVDNKIIDEDSDIESKTQIVINK